MGNPILRIEAENILPHEFNTVDLKNLICDLTDSMNHYGGIGIAAPQIGVSKKIAVIELKPDNERYEIKDGFPFTVFINPKLTILDQTLQGYWEGCLSVPGLRGFVERPKSVKIEYQNENGEKKELIAHEFLATVIQHELDHLFGQLYIDRLKDLTKLSYNEEYIQFHQKQEEF